MEMLINASRINQHFPKLPVKIGVFTGFLIANCHGQPVPLNFVFVILNIEKNLFFMEISHIAAITLHVAKLLALASLGHLEKS